MSALVICGIGCGVESTTTSDPLATDPSTISTQSDELQINPHFLRCEDGTQCQCILDVADPPPDISVCGIAKFCC